MLAVGTPAVVGRRSPPLSVSGVVGLTVRGPAVSPTRSRRRTTGGVPIGTVRGMGRLRHEDVRDGAFALVVTVFAQLDLAFNIEAATHYGSYAAAAASTAVATLALALRRRAPLLTAC